MLINIRDDDTNYFTSVEQLKNAYGDYLGRIPITLACTPFVTPHSFIMDDIPGSRVEQFKKLNEIEHEMSANELADVNRLYPLGDNKELVSFLSPLVDSGHVEIALHGYNHRFYDNGAEFIKNHINFYNVRDGKIYFEKLFRVNVDYFVPPSNKINCQALSFLSRLNMSLLSAGVIDCDSWFEYLRTYGGLALYSPKSIPSLLKRKLDINPTIIRNVPYFRSKTFCLDDTPDSFLKRNEQYLKSHEFISIATHYTTLSNDESYKERFFSMLDSLTQEYKEHEFVTVNELSRRVLLK